MKNEDIKKQTEKVCQAIRLINWAAQDFVICNYNLNIVFCPLSNILPHPSDCHVIRNDLIFEILKTHKPTGKTACFRVILKVLSEMLDNLMNGVAIETAEHPRSARLKKLINDTYSNVEDEQLRERIMQELEAALKEQNENEEVDCYKVWIPVDDTRTGDLKTSNDKYEWPELDYEESFKDIEKLNRPGKCSKVFSELETFDVHTLRNELNEAIEMAEEIFYFNGCLTINDNPIKNRHLNLALKSVINENPIFTSLVIGTLEEKAEQLDRLTKEND